MSGSSYHGYAGHASRSRTYGSADMDEVARAVEERKARVHHERERVKTDSAPRPRPVRDEHGAYDSKSVRSKITRPSSEATRVHVLLIDNSGSNVEIARHLRGASGYLLAMLGGIDSKAELAVMYFSDHCDGSDIRQDVDFVAPTQDGDRVLHSTTHHVHDAGGGDEAEAIECILRDACTIDFAHVPQERRHLYLVTDVVAHGMGLRSDDGCPYGHKWQDSVARVYETYGTFQVVGCSPDQFTGKLQAQFLAPKCVTLDLIDLSSIKSRKHRLGIVGNAFLFLAARNMGLQTAQAFLMTLYEKWLEDPIFGQNTDMAAREAIDRFLKYLEISEAERDEWRRKIFAT